MQSNNDTTKHDRYIALAMLLLPALFYLAYLAWHDWGAGLVTPYKNADEEYYLHYAWMKAFIDPAGGMLKDIIPPSPYVLLTTGAYKLFGPGLATPYLLNGLLFTATAFFSFAFTRNLFGLHAGIAAGVIACFCGPLLFFAGIAMKTIGVTAFLAASLYFLERYVATKKTWHLAIFALLATLLALERNNFLVFAPLLAGLVLMVPRDWRIVSVRAGAIAIAVAITAFAVNKPFADAHVTSPVGVNIYIGNSKIANGTYSRVSGIRNDLLGNHTDVYEKAEEMAGRPLTPLEAEWVWIQRTLDDIAEQPAHFIQIVLRKTLMMFSAYSPGTPNQYSLWRWHDPFLAVAVFDYGLILALAVAGIVLAWRRAEKPLWMRIHLALIVVYAATVIVFFVQERYRFPVMVALIPFAALIVTQLGRLRPKIIVSIAALYLATHLLNLANPEGSGWRTPSDRERQRVMQMHAANLPVYQYKEQAIEANDPHAWDRLAYHYYRRKLLADGKLFLDKYNAIKYGTPGNP